MPTKRILSTKHPMVVSLTRALENHPIPTLSTPLHPLSGIVPIRYYALRKINYERIMVGIVFPAKFIISMIYESGFYHIQQKRCY